ncbi:CIS tube protein [Paenibacillus sp. 481]|uniref:CIS tube protein n=1 Tax=Paenibacillus sp. 481 TaxID=2835869 RepID=UPI001E5CF476|nr:LysM peptidoglycan-binding domain-containing protein [Paenibacillus sp. 481]UHA73465.1 LysM peptidoglycan-binding domain-containing protein [Paenibacillus sp. 481]
MQLTKAKIIVDQPKLHIDVLFNPNEYSLSASNKYALPTIPGLSSPITQFISGDSTTLTMDLFFDTYELGSDVRTFTLQIVNLLNIDKDLHAPPKCRFVWGSMDFSGVLEKVTQKYTMFLGDGTPVRATLNVTFREVKSITEQLQQIPRQSADRTKLRQLKQGEQLWIMASEEYETPAMWREIAKANGIDNPRWLTSGMQLVVPRLE